MAEIVVLDPIEEATGREELALSDFIGKEGPDWGDAAIARTLASIPQGDLPVGDPRWPSRQIVLPLGALREMSGQTFQEARTRLEQKVGLIQTEQAGWLKREIDGEPLYAELTGATLKLGGGHAQARGWVDPDAGLILDALPHWVEAEEVHGPFVANGILVFTIDNLRGSVPGPIRIVTRNGGAVAWRSLLYALQSRHYDAGANAALSFEIEALTALEGATSQADSLAYGGNAIERLNLPTNWVGVGESAAAHTHTGAYRLWVRARDLTSGTADRIQLTAEYSYGSTVRRVRLPAITLPANVLDFVWVDLGEFNVPEQIGGQRWFLRLLARSTNPATGIGVRLDKLLLIPTAEAMGVVLGRKDLPDPSTFIAYDDFGLPAGALGVRTAKKGGAWNPISGPAGDAAVPAAGGVVQRTAVSDGSAKVWRLGIGVAALSAVRLGFSISALPVTAITGYGVAVFLRYIDANNFVSLDFGATVDSNPLEKFTLTVCVAGVVTNKQRRIPMLSVGGRYRFELVAEVDGRATGRMIGPGLEQVLELRHAALATGGALDDGGYALYEYWTDSTPCTRSYYDFQVFTPDLDAVCYPSKQVEVSNKGACREEPAAAVYPEMLLDGDPAFAPPSGMEGRTLRGLIVPSRGRPGETVDPTNDEPISTTVYTRGAHLFVPEPS